MSLYESMMTDCVLRIPSSAPDGEGGSVAVWRNGEGFRAAIVKSGGKALRTAERAADAPGFTVTSLRALDFHTVFRRLSDGACFRVTDSAGSPAPGCASFAFTQYSAESWREAGEL